MAELPHGGAISRYYERDAPKDVRNAIQHGGDKVIFSNDYPFGYRKKKKEYEAELYDLHLELMRLQADVQKTGKRVVVVFEGRDAAGKGGTIKRFSEVLNPRIARTVALSKPSDKEQGQWYFQRYIAHMPAEGEIVMFDRSWYNRAVVEHVFGFCTPEQRQTFFTQVPDFEAMLVEDGITLHKIWLNVGRAEQLRRFLAREADPLKQWKLSPIDIKGLERWDAYSEAIEETFQKTHLPQSPWTVIRSDDKRRARLAAISSVLAVIAYEGKGNLRTPNPAVCGGPDIWDA
ncbi:MAG: polyphosphate kinase 2 [Pseudomonadota bacterium]